MIERVRPHSRDARTGLTPVVCLRAALDDEALLGSFLRGASWLPWRTLLIASMGESLNEGERAIFTKLTGRPREPGQRVEELIGVIGRRGGKSRALATLATYLAGLCKHTLAPGEKGVVLVIAPDQRQAAIVLEYADACFRQSPMLSQLVVNRTSDTLELNNRINLEVRAASFRRLRGPTYVAVIADEAAFWMSDDHSSNPDTEIINAVRPGLATTRGPLIIASSPYAKRGVLYESYRRHYGPNGDPLVLVAQGASRKFNPSLPKSVVNRAMERDPASASAEYLARFRDDIAAFISREAVEACVSAGIFERAPQVGIRYKGFVDPSGGSSDSFTLAIAHRDKAGSVILDAVRERRPPFMPTAVVHEYAQLLKSYRISSVQGDHYAGEWPREQFRRLGIQYEASAKPKSDLYLELLPAINAATIDLLDNERLISQLAGLERRTARSGRDSIDHGPGGHDDLANSIAGVINLCAGKAPLNIPNQVLRWARLPRHLAAFARAASRAQSPPQTAVAMDSVSISDRHDQSRGASSYPTTPEHVGSTSWSDTRER